MARKKKDVPGVAEIRDLEEDGFLRAIIAAPKDDNVRLVYADWLQEKGDPRGEFIRCQVLAAQKQTPAAQKKQFNARAKELLEQHQWIPPCFRGKEAKITRGFVVQFAWNEEAEAPDDDELTKFAADPFFALTPMNLHSVHHWEVMGTLGEIVVRMPRLGCFGKLDLSSICMGSFEQDDRTEFPEGNILCSSPHLTGLRELCLACCGLKNKQIMALANNPAVASLKILNVGATGSEEVSGNFFDDKGVKALADSPHLSELEELVLSDSWMGDKGVKYLCDSRGLPKLKKLDLAGVSLSDKGYLTLAKSPFAARLKELVIGCGCYQSEDLPTDVGVRALAESPHLEHIKRLFVDMHNLSPELIATLRRRFGKRVEVWA